MELGTFDSSAIAHGFPHCKLHGDETTDASTSAPQSTSPSRAQSRRASPRGRSGSMISDGVSSLKEDGEDGQVGEVLSRMYNAVTQSPLAAERKKRKKHVNRPWLDSSSEPRSPQRGQGAKTPMGRAEHGWKDWKDWKPPAVPKGYQHGARKRGDRGQTYEPYQSPQRASRFDHIQPLSEEHLFGRTNSWGETFILPPPAECVEQPVEQHWGWGTTPRAEATPSEAASTPLRRSSRKGTPKSASDSHSSAYTGMKFSYAVSGTPLSTPTKPPRTPKVDYFTKVVMMMSEMQASGTLEQTLREAACVPYRE